MEKEIWRDLPEYEGLYQVSSFGNVRTFKNNRWGLSETPKLLKPGINGRGYYVVNLYKNSKVKMFRVHKLVSIVFLNHTPNGYEIVVNHIDNNPLNNHVSNLELVPQRYNTSCHKTDAGITKIANGKYKTQIRINNKKIHLGNFIDKEEGKRMYQLASENTHLFNGNSKQFRQLFNNIEK
jgi:hypothetical protein